MLLDVFGAGEDEEVLAVAAHDRGEVVELEEGGEALGVLLALLQALDDGELSLDEAQGAQREVDEGAADAGAQTIQLGGGAGDFGAEFLAGVGHLLALADEVLAVGLQGGDALVEGGGVRVQGVDRADDLGELVVATGELDGLLGARVLRLGQPRRAAAQDGERAGEGAGHRGGDAHGEQHEGAEDRDAEFQRLDVVVAELGEVLAAVHVERGLLAAHQVDAGGERRVELLRAGVQLVVGQRRLGGEGGEVLLGGVDLGPGDRGVVARDGVLRRTVAEVGQGGVGAQPGLLGGGAEGVALLRLGLGRGGLGDRETRDGAGDRLGGRRHVQGGQEQSPRGGGLLDGGVEFGEGVGAGTGPRRHLLRQLLGQPVQFGDGTGVRGMRLQRAALPGERGPSYGGDVVEVRAERGGDVGVGAEFVDLAVDAGAVVLVGRLGLGASGGDVGGDRVPLVGEGVGQRQRVLGLPGEGHQVLGVAQLARGGDEGGDTCRGDGGGHDSHGDDEPVAYVGTAPAARGVGHGGTGGAPLRGRLLACAPRPLLLHRCSHS